VKYRQCLFVNIRSIRRAAKRVPGGLDGARACEAFLSLADWLLTCSVIILLYFTIGI